MRFDTTNVTDKKGNDSWGIIIQDFDTEKDAKAFIKDLKKILNNYINKA